MSDQPLWDLVNGPPRKKLNLDLSRHDHRGDAGKFAVKPTAAPGKPDPTGGIGNNGSIKDPRTGSTLIIRKGGTNYTTSLIALAYGVKLPAKYENLPGSTLIPLSRKQLVKLLATVEAQCSELDSAPDPNRPQSALKSSEREGRVSSTGKRAPFGVPMEAAPGGGLRAKSGTYSNTGMPDVLLTPYLPGDWVETGEVQLSPLSQEIRNSIPRSN